ncbi:histidine--tRNA ligase, partial [bacterium]
SGGEKIPACGTTIGIDRILSAMDELELIPEAHTNTKVLVAMFSEELATESLDFAQRLRKMGIETEVFPEPKKLGKQFAYADKWKIPYVVVIGEDEAKQGLCTLKELSSGNQRIVKKDDAIRILLEIFKK